MEVPKHVAILIYGEPHSTRNALTEEKYKDLAAAFISEGFEVQSALYNDALADQLSAELLKYDVVLVWVNPIEKGNDRKMLDILLTNIANKGCFVSAHPEVILKMGTKEVLYQTKHMDWGGDINLYDSYEDFTRRFHESLQRAKIRVIKQYRGNGGNGVFKVIPGPAEKEVTLIHAIKGGERRILRVNEFYNEFKPFYQNDGKLIDQEWNKNISNGMVRCYLSGSKVAGFGYQEINALYETKDGIPVSPGKRYYYSENCGLFSDLKEIMENKWVPELQSLLSISSHRLPVIWDADFFINQVNSLQAIGKYSLCEINVSSVSPFPPSAISHIVEEVKNRLSNKE